MHYVESDGGPVDRFFEYTRHLDTSGYPDDYTHLADYLCEWAEHGDGIVKTGKRFETWLKTSLHVGNAVFKDPSLMDYEPQLPYLTDEQDAAMTPAEKETYYETGKSQPRPLEGIFDPDRSSSMIFDRDYYEHLVARLDHPRVRPAAGPAA